MNPLLKKVLAAVAIKEGIEKIQEMRNPRPSFMARITRPLMMLGAGGGAFWLYKTGKLTPLVEQAKSLTGKGSSEGNESTQSFTAPGGTNGATTSGAVSSSTTL